MTGRNTGKARADALARAAEKVAETAETAVKPDEVLDGAEAVETPQSGTQTADATEVADTTPAAPAEDPATKGKEGSGDADHVAAAPTGDGSDSQPDQPVDDVVVDRAAALANLAAGLGAGGETSGGEVAKDATPLPGATGVVREWGGSGRYLVLIAAFNAIAPDGMHVTAGKGDEVRIDEATAKRGVSLGALAPIAD